MDAVFGQRNFKNEIAWCYGSGGASKRRFSRKHDVIYFYARSGEACTFNVDAVREPYSSPHKSMTPKVVGDKVYTKMHPLGRVPFDWWPIPILTNSSKERTGFPTQKPLALLDRIIKASSNEGDVVLDPFAGCATACVAAERHGRQWIGIDISEKAAELVQSRVRKEIDLFHDFKPIHRTDQPHRTDLGKLPPPATHKDLLYGKQSGQCGGCMVMFHKRNLTLDHIVPRAYGGTDHIENLWLLCQACNSSKGKKSQAEFLKERVKRAEPIGWLL